MHVRDLVAADLGAVLALNNANVPALNELDATECARLAGLADTALVAEIDGAFAGFCWVIGPGRDYASLNYTWFNERFDDVLYLDRIAVVPARRRFGVGRAFYDALTSRFSGRFGVLACEVNLRPPNEASLQFHASIGFREVGRQDTDGGRKTVSLLTLSLAGQTPVERALDDE